MSPFTSHRCKHVVLGVMLSVCVAANAGAAQQHARKAAPAAVAPLVVEPALTDVELGVASAVHVGALACELGQSVQLDADPKTPGYFRLQLQKMVFRMRPVESRTGAVRLEDLSQGAVWIQLANKSMLMSQKLGRRLADECAGAVQRSVAQAMKLKPLPSLLDPQ